jgi:hypothetical protein
MDTRTVEEPLPHSTDLAGWRQAVADGGFRDFRMEGIIAAIQDLGPKGDKVVLNPLVLHVSDTIVRILRLIVSRNNPNNGEDIITRAHGHIAQSYLRPRCA